jgi:hypothetical protein
MAPHFEPQDHYVLRKLANEILPWMIGGRLVTRQWLSTSRSSMPMAGSLRRR